METYVAVDKNGEEWIYHPKPKRYFGKEFSCAAGDNVKLPKGTIFKIIGKELTWEDEPYLIE